MNWILWLIVAWLALSVVVALIAGQGIRMRDEQETFPPPDAGSDRDGTESSGERGS